MLPFLIRTVIGAAAILVIASASGGQIAVTNFFAALVAALVLGAANAFVKPILMFFAKSMTCVLSCLTLGLWSLLLSWLLNGAMFWIVGQLKLGLEVHNFWAALWGALALSIVNALATVFTRKDKDKED